MDKRELSTKNPSGDFPFFSSFSLLHRLFIFNGRYIRSSDNSVKLEDIDAVVCVKCFFIDRTWLLLWPASADGGGEKNEPFFRYLICIHGSYMLLILKLMLPSEIFSFTHRKRRKFGEGAPAVARTMERSNSVHSRQLLFWNGWMNFYRTSAFKYNGDLVNVVILQEILMLSSHLLILSLNFPGLHPSTISKWLRNFHYFVCRSSVVEWEEMCVGSLSPFSIFIWILWYTHCCEYHPKKKKIPTHSNSPLIIITSLRFFPPFFIVVPHMSSMPPSLPLTRHISHRHSHSWFLFPSSTSKLLNFIIFSTMERKRLLLCCLLSVL